MKNNEFDCNIECPVQKTVKLISGKWKPVILYHLFFGVHRFSELQKKLNNVTQRSLTLQLRELEKDGLIKRTIYPVIPPKVEYELTEIGVSMNEIIQSMYDWGFKHWSYIGPRKENN